MGIFCRYIIKTFYSPGSGVVHARSFGKSNCMGLRSLAASTSCCNGLPVVTGRKGTGGIYLLFLPLLELPLLVEDASSSF